MDAGVRLERDIARAAVIFLFFSCLVCSFYFAFFPRHSAVWNANLTNSSNKVLLVLFRDRVRSASSVGGWQRPLVGVAINTKVTGVKKVNGNEEVRENKSKGTLSRRVGEEGAEQRGALSFCPFLNSKAGIGFLLISALFVNYL